MNFSRDKFEIQTDFKENNEIPEVVLKEDAIEIDVLREIGSIGAGNAAVALSDLIQQKISIDVPTLHIVLDEEMEVAAIEEMGNIVLGAFLSAISDFTGIKLLPTPPKHAIDIFDAILDSFLARLCLLRKDALLFKTCFKCGQEVAHGTLVVFMSEKLQKLLIQKGKEWIEG